MEKNGLSSGPALLGAEWYWAAAKATVALNCSCFHAALRRRSLLRFAVEVPSALNIHQLLVSSEATHTVMLECRRLGGGGGSDAT